MTSAQPGPRVRTDLVDVFVFHRDSSGDQPSFLELKRAARPQALMPLTWQPVMGHVEGDEGTVACMARELREETGLDVREAIGIWQLETVHPFFIAAMDEIYLSPRFVVEVASYWNPTLNEEHDAYRWKQASIAVDRGFTWPHQRQAVEEIMSLIVAPSSPVRDALRVSFP